MRKLSMKRRSKSEKRYSRISVQENNANEESKSSDNDQQSDAELDVKNSTETPEREKGKKRRSHQDNTDQEVKESANKRKKSKHQKSTQENGANEETGDNDNQHAFFSDEEFRSSEENNELEKKKKRKSHRNQGNQEDKELEGKKKKNFEKQKSVSFSKKNAKEESDTSDEDDDEDVNEDEDGQFEVESVLDDKKIKGVLHYLIRWKGYGAESDTWEPESTLNCEELIAKYLSTKAQNKQTKSPKKEKRLKTKTESKINWDENKEFEVERILEVHFKRNGEREFLVLWKGFPATESTWEPETNLECPDLIKKFMLKVDVAKNTIRKELREYRKPTERLTLNTQENSRRLSRRLRGKQRVQYHDAE